MNYQSLTKVDLGFFPTPITPLSRLTKILDGPQIFIKRDDLSGLAMGGNKTRKLEYLLQDALNKGCDTIITAGASQSNHCRQTAAAAAYLNLDCHLVLGGSEPNVKNGNLLLDQLLAAHIHWAGDNRKGEDIPQICKMLIAQGKKPYVVPYGGSNELGAYGFIKAIDELHSQINLNSITHIVFASSSGGTHAGLMLGKAINDFSFKLIGINIDKEELADQSFKETIIELANKTSRFLELDKQFSALDVTLNDQYVGDGYGVVGELEKEAIELMAKHEGILLDPVYTGRAMGGLIDMIRTQQMTKQDKVLFWHTGGSPALFSYANDLSD